MGERKYCYKCMEKYDADQYVCPHCGYDENTPHDPMYIAPGTILHDRYLVGILLVNNGEGATYVGYDISTGCKVLLREYMPINLCTRVKNKAVISVNYNNLAKYKAFMAEYTELNKSLARLRNNPNINPVLDMFAENNTTYTVFEYIEGVKMLDYLKENAGELSWEQISKLFPPLFTTIGILHNAGIIHRAISPETVYITDKGELKLSGFCVSAVRTADAGLEHELFKGYAAPEQYSASSS
ncbi:MAG: protein kinase, partial [Ruminococcus sp.]|nr:protein kinase [Ruminococcus sp.]